MKKFIYFDMDGVLTDFNRFLQERNLIDYAYGNNERKNASVQAEKVIELTRDERIFANLYPSPYLEDFKDLINELKQNPDVHVSTLTSLGGHFKTSDIYHQKYEWLKEHGIDIPLLAVPYSDEKKYLAHGSSFLIDDHIKNVNQFHENGGWVFHYDMEYHHSDGFKTFKSKLNYFLRY